jgi:hypothetical protein
MENKLAALKVDETANEDSINEYQKDIKTECVSVRNGRRPCRVLMDGFFQEKYQTELNDMFATVDDRRQVSQKSGLLFERHLFICKINSSTSMVNSFSRS